MSEIFLEIFLIAFLIIFNGLLAGTEIAVISARKTRVKQLAEGGKRNADILLKLKEDPERFLATIQVGITLIGALASAIGGAASVKVLEPMLSQVPFKPIALIAGPIAIGIVVVIITYFTLIFGELVPKSIALRYPESIALGTARGVDSFSRIGHVFIQILTWSSTIVLKPFGIRAVAEKAHITEEEVKMLIREGGKHGVFEPTEERILQSIFEFTDMSVKEVMIPTTQMMAVQIDQTTQEIMAIMEKEQFSRYPVYGDEPNDIMGILYAKDFLTTLAKTGKVDIRKIIKPSFYIPATMKISLLLREMQKKRIHMAVVVDEYGGLSGLVTIEDLIEEIVGEIRDEYDTESPVSKLADGSMLIDAAISLRDLKEDYQIAIPESSEYETLAGFLITHLQKIPHIGDRVEVNGKRIYVKEMVGQRISKVRMENFVKPVGDLQKDVKK